MSAGVELDRTKVWVSEDAYQTKELVECIAEGIYRAYAYRFAGIWYEEDWWVLPELIFFGELMDEAGAKGFLIRGMEDVDFWDKGLFANRERRRFPGTEREMKEEGGRYLWLKG